jgi:hypothetical protein
VGRYFTGEELERLRELRARFLALEEGRGAGLPAYWRSIEDLELYERTFGARIGWKWDAVLLELARRARLPRGRTLCDWGCGTGIAVRRHLAAAGVAGVERVFLWDRHPLARAFAQAALQDDFPGLETVEGLPADGAEVLLVSHVLDELAPDELAGLLALARRSRSVLWVEPGSQRTSRALGAVRAELATGFDVLAPCTHQVACGALLPGAPGWCHFFARAPQEVYTEGRWSEFGKEFGIDLRSLPYSFLALAGRGTLDLSGPPARLVGRPRLSRGRAQLELCDASGLSTLDYLQRSDKRLFKALEDVAGEPWLVEARVAGGRIVELERRET